MAGPRLYRIRWGDTLSEVTHRHGITVKDLSRINGIADPDRIAAGQVIALHARDVCKVRILLIDWDRNPIRGAKVRLEYCGKTKMLTSKANGSVSEIITETPEDQVVVSIMRLDGSWETVARVRSGWGNKLVTLVSPKLKLVAETRMHPKDASGRPVAAPTKRQAPQPIPCHSPIATTSEGTRQSDFGDGKGVKTKEVAYHNGLPLSRVTTDQAEFEFLKFYKGDPITTNDYKSVAMKLRIEVAVIRAIEDVESGDEGFDNQCRPLILYERHHFSRLTKRRFDKANSDVASRKPYTFDEKGRDGSRIPLKDRYFQNQNFQYARLAKAYRLDEDAALQSCSWGKYQIMGFNFRICGFKSVQEFVAMMCESERKQLNAFANYVEATCLKAVREKDWKAIATAYNGANYARYGYHIKLERKYIQRKGEKV